MTTHRSSDEPADDHLWTIEEAARFMRMCRQTARPRLAAVALRFSPRCVRYHPDDVRALVARMRSALAPMAPITVVDHLAALGADLVVVEA